MNRKLQILQSKLGKWYVPGLIIILTCFIGLIGYPFVKPQAVHYRLNQLADTTIQAPTTVEDTYVTEQAREYARNSVDNVFVFQPNMAQQQSTIISNLNNWLESLQQVQHSSRWLLDTVEELDLPARYTDAIDTERDENQSLAFSDLNRGEQWIVYTYYYQQAPNDVQSVLSQLDDEVIAYLIQMPSGDRQDFLGMIQRLVEGALSEEIYTSDLTHVKDTLMTQVEGATRTSIAEQLGEQLLDVLIQPTMVFDADQTEARREEAAAAVQPSYILQGQVIVQEGHVIDQEVLRQLDLVGLANSEGNIYLAVSFVVLLILHAGILYFAFNETNTWSHGLNQAMSLTAYAFVISIMAVTLAILTTMETNGISYATLFFPTTILTLLLYDKLGTRKTVFANVFVSLLAIFILSKLADSNRLLMTLVIYLFSGAIALLMEKIAHLFTYMKRYLLSMAVSVFLTTLIGLATNQFPTQGAFMGITISILGSVAVSYGFNFLIHPYWDALLNDRARYTLNQLSSLNHPLLKELITRAPGSYQHSMMVANLSGNAVDAIGGDSLLARVGSYYHDIGKIVHPLFFTENVPANMESPHNVLSPKESAKIIIDHVNLGVEMLQENYFPQSIIDIAKQHHGTTQVAYFYYQAQQGEEPADIKDFTYPGPKPQSKEIAVIMIADSVEAASRSLTEYTQESITNLVDSIIKSKIDEEQFTESGLTIAELMTVRHSLIHGLASMNHTRVEYPNKED